MFGDWARLLDDAAQIVTRLHAMVVAKRLQAGILRYELQRVYTTPMNTQLCNAHHETPRAERPAQLNLHSPNEHQPD